jgi:hypothetical protein
MPEFSPTPINIRTGQTVRLTIQTVDGYGNRRDGYTPIITQVLFPDFSAAAGYPRDMTRVDTGLYVSGLDIPSSVESIGTFIASVFFLQPDTNNPVWETFTIQVDRPYGNVTVAPL